MRMTRFVCAFVVVTMTAILGVGCGDDDSTTTSAPPTDMERVDGGMCTPTVTNEDTDELCMDGIDNDCDGNADCLDVFGCSDLPVCDGVGHLRAH